MAVKAKICGLTTPEAVKAAVDNGAEYIGFVFYAPSPRNISFERAVELTQGLPRHVKTVAVMVNVTEEELRSMLFYFRPDYIQMHGEETPEHVQHIKRKFGIPVIKALKVSSSDDIAAGVAFSNVADMLLFDARAPRVVGSLPGGNGISFDWHFLENRTFAIDWFLSGGLTPENVERAVQVTNAHYVDVSSSVEKAPGEKDPALIKEFLQKVKRL